MKKKKNKEITKETIIIVGLVFFFAGYAVNGIIGSFTGQQTSNAANIVETQNTSGEFVQSQVDNLKEKLDANPGDTASWINLGNNYFDSDRYDDAIAAYLKALELKPDNPDVLSDLGVMYRRSGKPKNAISVFDEANRIDPTHTWSLFNKGIVQFYDLDQKNGAIETWEKLASIDPDFKMPTGELITDFLGTIK